jgi:2-keto-4-pentenoate hydratase/2-oxohepta-3-ene-1,7-dioic acid hydratase in catechol pathway
MKLLTYDPGSGPRAGVLVDDAEVLDASALLGSSQTLRDVQAVLEVPDGLDRLREALQRPVAAPRVPLTSVRLRSPLLRPPSVRDHIAFEEHASAQGSRQLPEVWFRLPIFYFSNPLCILGPDEIFPYPAATNVLDYELEIGAVIGRQGSNILEKDANAYIAGYTIYNDWSCRDLQFDEMRFGLGPAKGKDAATSLGPWLVTADELVPLLRDGVLRARCAVKVNGELWMDGNTSAMHHTFGAMVERASQDSRIVPGDVLGSGTVGGGSIGEAIRKGLPARYLQPGDVVEMEVEGLGVLRNTVGPVTNPNQNLRFRSPTGEATLAPAASASAR